MEEKSKDLTLSGPERRANIIYELACATVKGELPRGAKQKVAKKLKVHHTTVGRAWKSVSQQIPLTKIIKHVNHGNTNARKHDPTTVKEKILQLPERYRPSNLCSARLIPSLGHLFYFLDLALVRRSKTLVNPNRAANSVLFVSDRVVSN